MRASAGEVLALAQSEGLDCHVVVPLRSTNNAVFLLSDCAVVAKVHESRAEAVRELALGHALADRGAPSVRPAVGVGDHVRGNAGLHVTFWDYVADADAELSSSAIAIGLCDLHRHLLGLASLVADRSAEGQLRDAARALLDPAFAPLLERADRDLLQDTLVRAADVLRSRPPAVIHGSPHRFNIVVSNAAPVFIDFETVQIGPVEWDLAHLEIEVAHAYPEPFDDGALAECRTAVSAATATWCWGGLERGPDMRTHAEHHLAFVRSTT